MTTREESGLLKAYVDSSALQGSLGEPDRAEGGLSPLETQLLLLAEASEQGYVDFVTTAEAHLDVREPEGGGELMFGAPIGPAATPAAYRQALAAADLQDEARVLDVLHSLGEPRYIELRDLGEAGGGAARDRQRQGFHLWCAETSGCDVVLTCDRAFHARAAEAEVDALPVAGPGELLEAIGNRIGRWRTIRFLMKGRKRVRQVSTAR